MWNGFSFLIQTLCLPETDSFFVAFYVAECCRHNDDVNVRESENENVNDDGIVSKSLEKFRETFEFHTRQTPDKIKAINIESDQFMNGIRE